MRTNRTMITRIAIAAPTNSAVRLMVVSLMGAWTDIGGPGWTGEPAPGGNGAPGGAAGRLTKAPGGPGGWGAGGCRQPGRSVPLSEGGPSCSFILATPMLV